MLFEEALTQLQNGAALRRSSWPVDEGFLMLLPGMKHVWKIMLLPNPNAGNFIFSVEDFVSSDWELFTEQKPAVEAVVDCDEEGEKA